MTTHDDNVANLVNISQATIRAKDAEIECLRAKNEKLCEEVECLTAQVNGWTVQCDCKEGEDNE